MVTFNSWTDTRQISAASDSQQYLILLAPFWKMTSFETKWIAFFKHSLSLGFVFYPVFLPLQPNRQRGKILVSIKASFYARFLH